MYFHWNIPFIFYCIQWIFKLLLHTFWSVLPKFNILIFPCKKIKNFECSWQSNVLKGTVQLTISVHPIQTLVNHLPSVNPYKTHTPCWTWDWSGDKDRYPLSGLTIRNLWILLTNYSIAILLNGQQMSREDTFDLVPPWSRGVSSCHFQRQLVWGDEQGECI